MKLIVLGCSGSEVPRHNTPAFLIDGKLLLDAGTVGHTLSIRDEHGIKNILLTHAHFDHIKGIPFLLDNIVLRHTGNQVTIMSGKDVLDDLKKNIFNDRIWPDFTKIPDPRHPTLAYKTLHTSKPINVEGYTVIMEKVTHTVPAYGFIVVNKGKKALAYAGDTGPTVRFWEKMSEYDVKGLIVETSFPNYMEKLALASGHLTPSLLEKEIAKMNPPPPRIFVMHMKPQYMAEIEVEINAMDLKNVEFLSEGEIIEI